MCLGVVRPSIVDLQKLHRRPIVFDERDCDAWAGTIWFYDHLLALEFLLKIVNLKGYMRHGLDELRIGRIRCLIHSMW